MILTVTPSPAVDWTVHVPGFALGDVNRAESTEREASGKGINVATAVARHGYQAHAVFAGSGTGATYILDALGRDRVGATVTHGGPVRTNITLVTDTEDTKINTANETLDASAAAELLRVVEQLADEASVVVSAGSLPPGTADDLHARIVETTYRHGVRCAVDTSGAALAAAIEARPWLVKPNAAELAELLGAEPLTFGDVVDGANDLRRRGVGAVLVSLGAQGALLVDGGVPLWAHARPHAVRNAVGAGDALLAGFVADPSDRVAALTRAVVWATSAVEHPTTLFTARPAAEVPVTLVADPDRGQRLGAR
ncbi:1-phosphofructokinase family hexose kinase [Agromyces aerolatus]|uniref:1-phosphofructokinase family hexose kinase n=1 Tax=Agromyces sp. LY-1074 TaxID=3074080 RepID=UPI00285920B7|nr:MULTISPECIES: hexose kinase [unclassified Agromyces]MDR5700892.1 hexose kinase [Agromyces sp. LY-1074]MDR5707447.1 hexose kinase [Agromyces sp. LY-1358]